MITDLLNWNVIWEVWKCRCKASVYKKIADCLKLYEMHKVGVFKNQYSHTFTRLSMQDPNTNILYSKGKSTVYAVS